MRRGLTKGELELARGAFGNALPFERVQFVDGAAGNPVAKAAFRNGNSAITLRRRIHFNPAYYLADFSAGKPAARGLCAHELTHVWQYERLGTAWFFALYAREFARAGFKAWRMYSYVPGETRFADAMLEAQAQMVGNYVEALEAQDDDKARLVALSLAGSGIHGL